MIVGYCVFDLREFMILVVGRSSLWTTKRLAHVLCTLALLHFQQLGHFSANGGVLERWLVSSRLNGNLTINLLLLLAS